MRFLSGICLITDDVPRLSRFYQQVLQVEAEPDDEHVVIAFDGGAITLYAKAAAQRDMGFAFAPHHGAGLCKISFLVEDVDAEYARLMALDVGVEMMTPPTTYPWGARSMHFRDLDGNIVCFVQG